MNKSIVCVVCSLLMSLAMPALAQEKKVALVASEFPPFSGEQLPNGGPVIEITVEAFKKVGYQVEVTFLPFARQIEYAKNGEVDGIIMLWHTKEREEWSLFSDPLPACRIGFYKRKSDTISFSTYADLKPYKIGIVRGYANPPGFDEAKLNTDAVTFDQQNLQKLQANRIDLALIDKWVAQYLIRTKFPQFEAELEWMDPPLQITQQYLAISKKVANYEQKSRDFNQGLKELTDEGGVTRILEKHGLTE